MAETQFLPARCCVMEPQSGPPGASEADQIDLNSIFSLRQPKDAKAGAWRGEARVGWCLSGGARASWHAAYVVKRAEP